MSSRLALAVLVVLAPSVKAQSATDLARRIDSISALEKADRAQLRAYDVTHPRPNRLVWDDSVKVASGKVTIYMHANTVDIGRQSAAALDSLFARAGTAIAAFPRLMFSVRRDTSRSFARRRMVIVGYMPTLESSINGDAEPSPDSIAAVMATRATDFAIEQSKSEFGAWRRGRVPLGDFDHLATTDWGALRLELVSSESTLGRACYNGSITACESYLGLSKSDDPVTEWYDAPARRRAVMSQRDEAQRFQPKSAAQCLAGQDTACVSLLRAMGRLDDPPGSDSGRAAVTRQALALGGERAVERLLLTQGSAADALAAAAAAPTDSVVRAWQRNIHDRAAVTTNLAPRLAGIALGWIALLIVIAVKSSRWP